MGKGGGRVGKGRGKGKGGEGNGKGDVLAAGSFFALDGKHGPKFVGWRASGCVDRSEVVTVVVGAGQTWSETRSDRIRNTG